MQPNILAIVVAAFVFSLMISGLMQLYAKRVRMFDVPNSRSSHTIPTPRGGGLGIVIVFLCALIAGCLYDLIPIEITLAIGIGAFLVAAIGFIDDHGHVATKWRFLIQLVAATLAILGLGGLPEIAFGSSVVDLGIAGDFLAVIVIVWFVNLFNFMDGIDGIAAVEVICIAAGALLISANLQSSYAGTLLMILASSALGFLVLNWPPAKIFMGDVGSGFVGFVLAAIAIHAGNMVFLPIWTWLILASVFLVDSTVTLLTRMMNGDEWYSAHNSHAYQIAARRLNSHRSVTLAVLAINILWLIPLAWCSARLPEYGWLLTIVAIAPLILLARFLRAGHRDSGSMPPVRSKPGA